MKGSIASAVALAGVASAAAHGQSHHRAHQLLARGDGAYGEDNCITTQYCTTYVTTIYPESTRKYSHDRERVQLHPDSPRQGILAMKCHGHAPDLYMNNFSVT